MSIQVENLSKSYSYYKKEVGFKNSIKNLFKREMLIKEAVNNISFEIDKGEVVGFLGPNGAGKTTTLKMLSGILYPTDGKALVEGYVPWERKKNFKKQMSIVMGQKNQLWWDLPANESLYLNKCIYEIDDDVYQKTLNELTELLDVKELLKVQVRRLSLGERMKMEIIAALIHQPKVILLDEPTIGLDLISQIKIREFLKLYNQEKKATIILTSHYMDDIKDMCKRVIIINDGKSVYNGELNKLNELFSQKKIMKVHLSRPVDEGAINRFGLLREFGEQNAVIEVESKGIKEISKAILDCLPVVDFTIEDIPIGESIALLYEKGEKLYEYY
jgi:ABC-2 type transport system ATP-binding protein